MAPKDDDQASERESRVEKLMKGGRLRISRVGRGDDAPERLFL